MASLLNLTQSLMKKYIDGRETSSHIILWDLPCLDTKNQIKKTTVSLVKTDAKIVSQNLATQSPQYIFKRFFIEKVPYKHNLKIRRNGKMPLDYFGDIGKNAD